MGTQTRQKRIDAAFELVRLHGLHAVGPNWTSGKAGLTKTTFYHRLDRKDHPLREVIRYRDTREIDLAGAAASRPCGSLSTASGNGPAHGKYLGSLPILGGRDESTDRQATEACRQVAL